MIPRVRVSPHFHEALREAVHCTLAGFSWLGMFSVVGETLTLVLASLPAILKVDLASSNASLAPALALCVVCSAALGVLLTSSPESGRGCLDLGRPDRPRSHSHNQHSDEASPPASQKLLDGSQARQEASAAEGSPTVVAATSLRRRPADSPAADTTTATGLDFERRDSEELLELSLRAAAEKQGTAPSSSDKNGDLHGSNHTEAKSGATTSNNNNRKGGGSATTTSSALQRRSPSAAAAAAPAPPTTPTPARRQRHHHHYRKGGEVLFIAEGVAQAAVGIIRDPVRGAQADGARGLVRGIGSGVFGVVLKPVKGVAKAGVNAYTGVRIGVTKAGRVVVGSSRGGSTSAPSSESKVRRCGSLLLRRYYCHCRWMSVRLYTGPKRRRQAVIQHPPDIEHVFFCL